MPSSSHHRRHRFQKCQEPKNLEVGIKSDRRPRGARAVRTTRDFSCRHPAVGGRPEDPGARPGVARHPGSRLCLTIGRFPWCRSSRRLPRLRSSYGNGRFCSAFCRSILCPCISSRMIRPVPLMLQAHLEASASHRSRWSLKRRLSIAIRRPLVSRRSGGYSPPSITPSASQWAPGAAWLRLYEANLAPDFRRGR
jgi:hypothetical protein